MGTSGIIVRDEKAKTKLQDRIGKIGLIMYVFMVSHLINPDSSTHQDNL